MSGVAWFKIEPKNRTLHASIYRGRVCRGEFHLEDGRWYRTHWMQYDQLVALLKAKGLNPANARKDVRS